MSYSQQEANPNGGYLNENQYGLFGKVTVTPELLAEIQRSGFVTVSVSKAEQRGTHPDTWVSARCTMKPYVQAVQQPAHAAPAQVQAPVYNQAPVQHAPAPVQQHVQPQAPAAGAVVMSDEIPF